MPADRIVQSHRQEVTSKGGRTDHPDGRPTAPPPPITRFSTGISLVGHLPGRASLSDRAFEHKERFSAPNVFCSFLYSSVVSSCLTATYLMLATFTVLSHFLPRQKSASADNK